MAKAFMGEDFLLKSELAVKLFEDVKDLPIIDYHCHLNPKEIADNRRWDNIAQMWLGGDHYKWRLMRAAGVDERFITGDAGDWEKFERWAETVEEAIGSPLHHWTHLELKRYFNCDLILNKRNAKAIWDHCNGIIWGDGFDVAGIMKKFKVETVVTTDDPADDLEHHAAIKSGDLETLVLPAWRPGNAMNIEAAGWRGYIAKLAGVSGVAVTDYASLLMALNERLKFFAKHGCTLSDHALDPMVYEGANSEELTGIVKKALAGGELCPKEIRQFKTELLVDLGRRYAEMGWVWQLHMCALRNNNAPMFEKLGPDTGYDAIYDEPVAKALSGLLNRLQTEGKLPKTVIYSLNPMDDDTIAVMLGSFQGGSRGKVQFGSAWWFNDHKTGMEKQMVALANNGLLAAFVGMLTDSRSFLSYTRHEYFRRIMCNLIAQWVEDGEFPGDYEVVSGIAKNIAYFNAKGYFGF